MRGTQRQPTVSKGIHSQIGAGHLFHSSSKGRLQRHAPGISGQTLKRTCERGACMKGAAFQRQAWQVLPKQEQALVHVWNRTQAPPIPLPAEKSLHQCSAHLQLPRHAPHRPHSRVA